MHKGILKQLHGDFPITARDRKHQDGWRLDDFHYVLSILCDCLPLCSGGDIDNLSSVPEKDFRFSLPAKATFIKSCVCKSLERRRRKSLTVPQFLWGFKLLQKILEKNNNIQIFLGCLQDLSDLFYFQVCLYLLHFLWFSTLVLASICTTIPALKMQQYVNRLNEKRWIFNKYLYVL